MNGGSAADYAGQKARMVAEVDETYAQTASATGLKTMSAPVRRALSTVDRHRLVDPSQAASAYENRPLAIGAGQTISQPYIVALSTDLLNLQAHDVVLDVGTGSGYQAAVLAEIAKKVYSIELIPALGETARKRLEALGYANIEVKIGDGYKGWPEKAPFDAIVVTAAAPHVPQALVDQLKPGGRLVIPVGSEGDIQFLMRLEKQADGSVTKERILPVRFVPLVPGK